MGIKKYFNVTDDPAKADYAIVFVTSPNSGVDYDKEDKAKGGNGYVPISLQYGLYTAHDARAQSIASGDPVIDPDVTSRSYKGKTVTATNIADLKSIQDTKEAMNGKPVIVSMALSKPAVVAEFEKVVNAIVADFGVNTQAILDILSGKSEPSALLPLQMPEDMNTVEKQLEDIPHDMKSYVDSEGNKYDFGYGLNWKAMIKDERTAKYKK